MKPRVHGMTLLEMLIAVAITSMVMTVSVSVLMTGVTLARKGEQVVSSSEASRLAMGQILRDLKAAGMGAPGGLIVAEPGNPPVMIDTIFTQEGTLGTDMLWLVVPRANVMASNCARPGSGVPLAASSTGTLTVVCTTPALTTGDTLMVSNFTTAALISNVTFPSATTISYDQKDTTFSNSPTKGVFQRGDVAFPVDIIRYSIQTNPTSGRPELWREMGTLNSPLTQATPFQVVAGAQAMVMPHVEDLQVAFGAGTPPNLTFASAHSPAFDAATAPQSVRVSVVGVTPLPIRAQNMTLERFKRVTVEDHVASGPIDGYRRSVYRRRVDLPNLNPANM